MQGYFGLANESRRTLLLTLAREYDLNRKQVCELMKQYLGLELPSGKLHVIVCSNCSLLFFSSLINLK